MSATVSRERTGPKISSLMTAWFGGQVLEQRRRDVEAVAAGLALGERRARSRCSRRCAAGRRCRSPAGRRCRSRRRGRPAACVRAPARRSASSSATAADGSARGWPRSTSGPRSANADFSSAGTTSSRSASLSTITQFLPPISAITRLIWRWPGCSFAAVSRMFRPAAQEPVKTIVWMRGSLTSALPGSSPPGSRCSASSGTPAACSASTTAFAHAGACSAGLRTTALPVASAAETMPAAIASGKFQGAITPVTPRGT